MQCMLCGFKFDIEEAVECECNCAFGGCKGRNVRCPNCGHEMLRPQSQNGNSVSVLSKIKKSLKI